VADDRTIGQTLESSLAPHGHEVHWVLPGAAGLREAERTPYDLVLLDLRPTDPGGVEVCRELRSAQPRSVLVVLTPQRDGIAALAAGADDFLTKPVRLGDLLATVRAHLRRGRSGVRRTISVGPLVVDTAGRHVTIAGQEIPLRAKEFDLLARLAEVVGAVVSREALMADVWDAHRHGSTKTLDVHIASLRRKLALGAPTPGQVPRISTLRGRGYRLELAA
jgi:DNA-binding response OmpR family regulator